MRKKDITLYTNASNCSQEISARKHEMRKQRHTLSAGLGINTVYTILIDPQILSEEHFIVSDS